MELYGKKIVIYGAGVSGLSAWQLVREHGGNAVIYDDNPQKEETEALKTAFYKLHFAEREADMKAYIEGGGDPANYKVLPDADEEEFKGEISRPLLQNPSIRREIKSTGSDYIKTLLTEPSAFLNSDLQYLFHSLLLNENKKGRPERTTF